MARAARSMRRRLAGRWSVGQKALHPGDTRLIKGSEQHVQSCPGQCRLYTSKNMLILHQYPQESNLHHNSTLFPLRVNSRSMLIVLSSLCNQHTEQTEATCSWLTLQSRILAINVSVSGQKWLPKGRSHSASHRNPFPKGSNLS